MRRFVKVFIEGMTQRTTRKEEWRLIESYKPPHVPRTVAGLYDVESDPMEVFDLIEKREDKVEDFGELNSWVETHLKGCEGPKIFQR